MDYGTWVGAVGVHRMLLVISSYGSTDRPSQPQNMNCECSLHPTRPSDSTPCRTKETKEQLSSIVEIQSRG
jgi:hypothetical protein